MPINIAIITLNCLILPFPNLFIPTATLNVINATIHSGENIYEYDESDWWHVAIDSGGMYCGGKYFVTFSGPTTLTIIDIIIYISPATIIPPWAYLKSPLKAFDT